MATSLLLTNFAIGSASLLIRLVHFLRGRWSVIGSAPTTVTIDSHECSYAAVSIGFGPARIWAARQPPPVPSAMMLVLAGTVMLSGLARSFRGLVLS